MYSVPQSPVHTRNRRPLTWSAGLLLGILATDVSADEHHNIIDDTALPGVGELADRTITPAEEANLKKLLRARLYGELPIEDDPESNTYMQTLLAQLRASNDIELEFDILIVRSRDINAFAMPGGLLAFNTGLIGQANTESELLGVLAHEMAHVTQRHIARMYDEMEHSNLSILASAAVLLAGAYSLSTILPTLMVGQAAQIQEFLNHSRASEQEADRFATRYLAKAGIDPNGVANFFHVLMKKSSQPQGKDFEYLSTHPTSQSRIVEAQNRALQYKGRFIKDRPKFSYIRERLNALLVAPHVRLQHYQNLALGNELTDVQRYGFAVVLQRRNEDERALAELQKIQPATPGVALLLELAAIRSVKHLGQIEQALERLLALYEQFPQHNDIEWYLIQAHLDMGNAQEALRLARVRIRRGVQDPQSYRLLAEAADATNQPAVVHLALADHYISQYKLRLAVQQVELAEKHIKINSANQARVQQRRKQILEMAEAL